ncbi:MAG: DUF3108 domain-containing protein [Lentimicrobium sp.]|nr:DUF3108 domain-containing protein [Lentimicrobium sp.]
MNIIRSYKILVSIVFLMFSHSLLIAQSLRYVQNTAFDRGEKLTFRVYYQSFVTGKVTAGEAKLEVKKKAVTKNDRPTYHIIGTGQSKGAFNFFFKVNDRFETFVDEQALIPWYFIRRTREGGYKKDDEVSFMQTRGVAVSRKTVKKIPINTQDILSVFYYARTLDITGMKPNESFPLSFFLDDSVYVSKIVFLGREQIKTELGTFNCLKFKPMVIKGEVFSEPYPMELWITDDKNRLPIMVSSAVIVGSAKMELVEYEGIKNPLYSRISNGAASKK